MVSDDLVPSLGLLDISGATIECMRAGIVEVVGLERETEVINALVWYSSLEEYSLLLETSADHPLSVDERNEVATVLAICIAPEVLEQFTDLESVYYTETDIYMLECIIQDPGTVDNFIVPLMQAILFRNDISMASIVEYMGNVCYEELLDGLKEAMIADPEVDLTDEQADCLLPGFFEFIA